MKRELLNYKKELRKVIEICLKAYDYVKQDVLSNIFMFIEQSEYLTYERISILLNYSVSSIKSKTKIIKKIMSYIELNY